ncbi:MAG: cytochrome-c peroxidase [Aureispira sp.]
MKKVYGFTALITLPVLLGGVGCQIDETQDLDQLLTQQLETSSYGVGSSYYKLPDSDDFNNIPQDPNNPITEAKVTLGKAVFHETAFAVNVKFAGSIKAISCATCHNAPAGFQAGMVQGIADGGLGFGTKGEGRIIDPACPIDSIDVQPIRTPSSLNAAYQKVMRWAGSMGATGSNIGTESQWTTGTAFAQNHLGFEGVETQSIVGLTGHRQEMDSAVIHGTAYKALFDAAFPSVPATERYTKKTAGLAIAAYSRTVLANQAPFQKWIKGDKNAMTAQQKQGALLFFGDAGCYRCHNGPALATETFHAIGTKDLYQNNNATIYKASASSPENLGRGGFTGKAADNYKFKIPQLYNLRGLPQGHGGSFNSVKEIVKYKNQGIPENPNVPASQITPMFAPLGLSEEQVDQLTDFINNALYDDDLERYVPSSLPTGQCFPNADTQSKVDLGCQ